MKNVLPPFLNSTFYILNFTFTFEVLRLRAYRRSAQDDRGGLFIYFPLQNADIGQVAVALGKV